MWDWAIWGALIASALAVLAALALLVIRALQGWHELKRVRRHLMRGVEGVAERAAELAENAARSADTSAVMESLARLRLSLARLAVLREAVDEARDSVGRLTAVMPRR